MASSAASAGAMVRRNNGIVTRYRMGRILLRFRVRAGGGAGPTPKGLYSKAVGRAAHPRDTDDGNRSSTLKGLYRRLHAGDTTLSGLTRPIWYPAPVGALRDPRLCHAT